MATLSGVPPTLDFPIYRGDTTIRTVRVKNRSTRQLEDLTGAVAPVAEAL